MPEQIDRMDVLARAECPTHGHRTVGGIYVEAGKRVCSACHAPVVRVEYVPASQLRGAVEALSEIAGGGYDDDHGKWRYYSQVDMRQIANRALDRLGGQ